MDGSSLGTVYAGSEVDEGVYATTDGGATWTAVVAGLPRMKIVAIVVDPANPKNVYVAPEHGGVWKSATR